MKPKTAAGQREGRSEAPARALRLAEQPAPAPSRARAGDVAAAALLALGAAFERRRDQAGNFRRAWLAAGAIIVVNYVAFRAQLRFWQAQLDRADALLVSVALESIAIFWAAQAHAALVRDDSALRPRLAAYGTALVIGVLNYSHYCGPDWKPAVPAVTFGMMSVISPWLWSGYSRRSSRDVLKARGLIEDHAVRLGHTRWLWHAYACCRVMFEATWTGESRPAEALALWQPRRYRPEPATVKPPQPAAPRTPLPARRAREPRPEVTAVADGRAAPVPALAAAPDGDEAAVTAALVRDGRPLPAERRLAEAKFSGSRRAARRVLAAAEARMSDDGHEGP